MSTLIFNFFFFQNLVEMKYLELNFIKPFVVEVTMGTVVNFLRKLNILSSIQKVPGSNSVRRPIVVMFFVISSVHLHVFLYSPLNQTPTNFILVHVAIHNSQGTEREARSCTQLTGIDIPKLDKLCNKWSLSEVGISIPIGCVGLEDLSSALQQL